jgi:hypothetical protein
MWKLNHWERINSGNKLEAEIGKYKMTIKKDLVLEELSCNLVRF